MFPFWIELESTSMVQLAVFVAAGLAMWVATGVARGLRV